MVSRTLHLAVGLAALSTVDFVSAQANHAIEGWKYTGCVVGKPSDFSLIVDFFRPVTPEECQKACNGGSNWTALG
jgi:hypothetical protein